MFRPVVVWPHRFQECELTIARSHDIEGRGKQPVAGLEHREKASGLQCAKPLGEAAVVIPIAAAPKSVAVLPLLRLWKSAVERCV
jgi:hypothetical protein